MVSSQQSYLAKTSPSPSYLHTSLAFTFTILLFLTQCTSITKSFSTGELRTTDIAGIWRLTSKKSFLPKTLNSNSPLKEFTVYPKKKPKPSTGTGREDILLLLREDGKFVQYAGTKRVTTTRTKTTTKTTTTSSTESKNNNKFVFATEEMKGSWGLVDGKLILAADRPNDNGDTNSRRDTILEGRVVAVSDEILVDNPALQQQQKEQNDENNGGQGQNQNQTKEKKQKTNDLTSVNNTQQNSRTRTTSTRTPVNKEDVHLSVPKGKVKIGKFFYPQNHPSFFEQPMFDPTSTGSFELRQILGNLNTQLSGDDEDEQLVEKFRKKDLMDKRYFITSYPLPKRKKKKRWSIKYNKFVDSKPQTNEQKEWEEKQKNAPIPIKTFEVDLFANNTFQTVTGLGDTILRGKWSIVGDNRDQLWMKVWRFGFGRAVSGSTYSEGSHLSQKDDVAYWGKIYEVDVDEGEDSIDDNPLEWKGTKIEINGSVMLGVGLEPCSIARFTMIEKTEDDYYDDEEDEEYIDDDTDDDNDNLPELHDGIGSFE